MAATEKQLGFAGHDNQILRANLIAVTIQTLIRPRSASGYAGGPSLHTVPADTTLASFFSISATGGVYRLDTPVTIAPMQGKPVMLVVGKPTK